MDQGAYKLSSEEYHGKSKDGRIYLTRSTIKELLFDCPKVAWYNHPNLNPDWQPEEPQEKFSLGTVAHALTLEGIDKAAILEYDSYRSNAAKAARDEAYANCKIPMLAEKYEEVKRVVEAAKANILSCRELGINDLQTDGEAELSLIWEEGGTWCKVRPDFLTADRKLIVDLKFTEQSANPENISRHIASMNYQIQNSLYCRGSKAVFGILPKFVFAFQEINPPYLCSFIGLTPAFLDMGESQVEMGIYKFRECLSKNDWPGYTSRVAWIEPPPWVVASWESICSQIGIGR